MCAQHFKFNNIQHTFPEQERNNITKCKKQNLTFVNISVSHISFKKPQNNPLSTIFWYINHNKVLNLVLNG